jgi:hypothetical protein
MLVLCNDVVKRKKDLPPFSIYERKSIYLNFNVLFSSFEYTNPFATLLLSNDTNTPLVNFNITDILPVFEASKLPRL